MKAQIWFQPGPKILIKKDFGDEFMEDYNLRNRFRIISGKDVSKFSCDGSVSLDGMPCCWDNQSGSIQFKLKRMHEFDEKMGYPKAIYIGEI